MGRGGDTQGEGGGKEGRGDEEAVGETEIKRYGRGEERREER